MLRCKHVGIHLASDVLPDFVSLSVGCRKYSKVLDEAKLNITQRYITTRRQNTKATRAIHGTNCASDIRSVIWLAFVWLREEESSRRSNDNCL